MSIDKFGHYFSESPYGPETQGLKGEGFKLTSDGDYDMVNRRLCNVGDAKEDEDAVNLKRIRTMNADRDKQLNDQMSGVVNELIDNINGRLGYARNTEGDYLFKNSRLCDIGDAVDDKDAVNLSILKKMIEQCKEDLKVQLTSIIDGKIGKSNLGDSKHI